jgi:mono/diheme cytochrome c family protein
MSSGSCWPCRSLMLWLSVLVVGACGASAPAGAGAPGSVAASMSSFAAGLPDGPVTLEQVLLGRQLVISSDCGACHGGGFPGAEGWLAGNPAESGAYVFGEYRAWAPNLTPDPQTGLGRYSDRQVFNALRWGLRPGATPDVEIASATPGVGNHPVQPDYLSPLMPWASWRHKSDRQLWAVIAYLRHGVAPVRNEVRDHESPPDRWARESTRGRIGPYPAQPFPTVNEELREGADGEQVLRGRSLSLSMGCGECHGGRGNPAAAGWLTGVMSPEQRPHATPFEQKLQVGPFATYPRNLTPDNTTGLGRFSERQIFNALRYGLRPGETADVEITSAIPGEGNHPLHPKYLPPSMPWAAWRHLADEELWAIAAYLKHGLKPVRNRVPDSEGPPDFWASLFTPENFGTYPAASYPTAHERLVR